MERLEPEQKREPLLSVRKAAAQEEGPAAMVYHSWLCSEPL